MALTMVTASVGDTDSLPSTGTGRQLAMAYLQAFKRANFCEYEHAKYEHSGRPPGGAKATSPQELAGESDARARRGRPSCP